MTTTHPPGQKRSKRIYILWGVALALLLSLGLVCWLVVVPYYSAKHAVQKANSVSRDDHAARQEIVQGLGSPEQAAWKLGRYIRIRRVVGDSSAQGTEWDFTAVEAVLLLRYCGRPGLARLFEIIRKRDTDLGMAAKVTVTELGPEFVDLVPPLIAALSDPDLSVVIYAAQALGSIGPGAAGAVPALEKLKKEGQPGPRQAAADALKKIRAENLPQ